MSTFNSWNFSGGQLPYILRSVEIFVLHFLQMKADRFLPMSSPLLQCRLHLPQRGPFTVGARNSAAASSSSCCTGCGCISAVVASSLICLLRRLFLERRGPTVAAAAAAAAFSCFLCARAASLFLFLFFLRRSGNCTGAITASVDGGEPSCSTGAVTSFSVESLRRTSGL